MVAIEFPIKIQFSELFSNTKLFFQLPNEKTPVSRQTVLNLNYSKFEEVRKYKVEKQQEKFLSIQ